MHLHKGAHFCLGRHNVHLDADAKYLCHPAGRVVEVQGTVEGRASAKHWVVTKYSEGSGSLVRPGRDSNGFFILF